MPSGPSRSASSSVADRLSNAQARILAAAAELFAEHGVGGTSLQMIADAIGVTKAAVYHQFNTKEKIVIAVAEIELDEVRAAVEAAEAAPDAVQAQERLVHGMVDLAVDRRRMESTLLGDPVIVRYFAHQEAYRQVMGRLYRILLGDQPGPAGHVPAAMLTAAIGGAVIHPLVADVDDETLRVQLRRLARRFLDLPD